MTTWTKITKASGTSWIPIPKATTASGSGSTINAGNPIGLLLSLTYATTNVNPGSSGWTKITKASGTTWTNIAKAT